MSKTDSLHYKLCCKGAEWLMKKPWAGIKYTAVELICQGLEQTDVYGTNGFDSYIIEVKTNRSDFVNDLKKKVRREQFKKYQTGNWRYYLAPKGIIKIDQLPEKWGLIEYDIENDTMCLTREAEYQTCNNFGDITILCSIMRREGIKKQIFNYRKNEC